jgi:hypothetical protein
MYLGYPTIGDATYRLHARTIDLEIKQVHFDFENCKRNQIKHMRRTLFNLHFQCRWNRYTSLDEVMRNLRKSYPHMDKFDPPTCAYDLSNPTHVSAMERGRGKQM